MSSVRHFDNCRIDSGSGKEDSEALSKCPFDQSASRNGCWFKGSQTRGQRRENPRPQREIVELAFAANFDQTCGFQLLDVVRERGCGNGQCGQCLSASQRAAVRCDLLQKLESPRIGQRLQDERTLSAVQARGFRCSCCSRGLSRVCHRIRRMQSGLQSILDRRAPQSIQRRFDPGSPAIQVRRKSQNEKGQARRPPLNSIQFVVPVRRCS